MRKKAGLTQEKLAEIMETKKSNISRLESVKHANSPRISRLMEYAKPNGAWVKVVTT